MEKVKDLSWILAKKGVSLELKGKVYVACVKSGIVHGSETWAMIEEMIDWRGQGSK